ncbi:MAG TPA: DUF4382 domain-containing protein [Longimicrobiales bacterium]|nr:DUF4382 domain-containing protein [Longimicrobiales bacterium]
MIRTIARTFALATAVALPLAACGDDDSFAGPQTGGEISIYLTDEPGDVQAAFVTIARVELLGDPADAEVGSIVTLRSEPWTGDLLELQNDIDVLVDGADVPAGTWRQIRLVIPEACIRVETETQTATGTEPDSVVYASSGDFDHCGDVGGTLLMPSFDASGLKIQLPGGGVDFAGGADAAFLLDFDVSQSFGRQAGQSGMWVMNPVIRVDELDNAANVEVSLALGTDLTLPTGVTLESFGVELDGESAVMFDADGELSLGYVLPGQHTLTLVGPSGLTLTSTPTTPHTFEVSAETGADVALTLTGIS